MSERKLHIRLVSPKGVLFDGEADKVTLPGAEGKFMVLPRHAPIISALVEGEVVYSAEGVEESVAIAGGFADVKDDTVTVAVEVA